MEQLIKAENKTPILAEQLGTEDIAQWWHAHGHGFD
jgi:hypothetical protein